MLNVQKYLIQEGNSFESLSEEFGVRVKKYDSGLVVLNYDQIESPKHHPICDECRGLILNSQNEIVSKSFDRFYNEGEGDANKLDNFNIDDILIYEKADGSIIKIYRYNGRWEISTRGTAYAEATNAVTGKSFREMVLDCLGLTEDEFQEFADHNLPTHCTYVFEFISPFNRIVTPYEEPMLVLLSIITHTPVYAGEFSHAAVMYQADLLSEANRNIRAPKVYSASNIDDIPDMVSSLEGLQEGFVIRCTNTNRRIKIKNLQYLKAHRIRGDSGIPSFSDIAELIVTNETSEFLAYFPEFTQMFEEMQGKYDRLIEDSETVYNMYKDLESQKDFALKVKDSKLSSCMFEARNKKVSFKHAVANAKTSHLVKTLLSI